VLLTERGLGGKQVDIAAQLSAFRADGSPRAKAARTLAERLANTAGGNSQTNAASPGALLVDAYPDRVARARGGPGRFLLANGRGGVLDPAEPLAYEPRLDVADLQGRAENARIAAAAAIDEADVLAKLASRITRSTETHFDYEKKTVRVRELRRLGAIVVSEANLPPPHGKEADGAVLAAVREHGLDILPWDREAAGLRRRLSWLHETRGAPWPAMDDAALLERLAEWLAPFLAGEPALSTIRPSALRDGLMALVPYEQQRRVDALAPTHFEAPSGSRVPIRYEKAGPVLSIRVQELFGLIEHPMIGG